jgi:hypothetical protein
VVCHCTFCQRATGSALAVWPTYRQGEVRCGTTVTSTFEQDQSEVSILGGTFDDTSWIGVDRHIERSSHPS